MSSSLIFQRFAERLNNPEVLTNPQKYLGLRYNKVVEFWNRIENLSKEQLRVVEERYDNFYDENLSEWDETTDLTLKASREVVGGDYAYNSGWVVYDVIESEAAGWATLELIGGVENPTFLPMFDDL